MATPFDTRIAELPPHERAELERRLAERPRRAWVSDEGDGLAFHLLLALAAVGGVVAMFTQYTPAEILESYAWLPSGLPHTLASPVVGFTLAALLLPLLAWRFAVLHGRHGWMATSFGLVRVRGPRLRVVRWNDVVQVTRRRIGRGYSIVELTTSRGVLECDTAALLAEIRQHVPPGVSVPA